MIRNLKLEKYRGFDSYELTELSRVNLLVGKNNCGKTSILEAIDLFVSEGHPSVLEQCADRQRQQGTGPQRRQELLLQQLRGAAAGLVELLPGSPAALVGALHQRRQLVLGERLRVLLFHLVVAVLGTQLQPRRGVAVILLER